MMAFLKETVHTLIIEQLNLNQVIYWSIIKRMGVPVDKSWKINK